MKIRIATVQDLEGIKNIYNPAITDTTASYRYLPYSDEEIELWFREKQQNGMPVIVAEDLEGQIAGFASYGIFRPWDGFKCTVEHGIYVDKGHFNQGVGGLLLAQLIQLATTEGFHSMIAAIDANNTNSLNFHKKHLFTEVGRIMEAATKFGKFHDLVLMQKMLTKK